MITSLETFNDSDKNVYAFILYVSDSGLQCNKHNSYWYGAQYHIDRLPLDRGTDSWKWYWPSAWAISFSLIRTTTLRQSVYPDITLHISNYYINIHVDITLPQSTSVSFSAYYIYPVEWKTQIWHLKDLILTLFGLIFRHI